jgi:sugar phosphate isomerase/epimerase
MTFAGPSDTRLIGLAAGVHRDFTPLETVLSAIDSGFDGVGIWVEPDNWTAATTRELRQCLVDSGLEPMDVEVIWIKPGGPDPNHFKILDIGAELGAPNALVVSSDPDIGATIEKYSALCRHGAERNMRVSLEFAVFTEVKTLANALYVVSECQSPAAAILVDPLHLQRSGGTPEQVSAVPRRYFSYAQFCDAPLAGPSPDDISEIVKEAQHLRLQAGAGGLPLGPLLKAMPDGLPLSVELRSKTLRETYPDAHERAVAVAAATRKFLDAQQ